jgi:DNA-binding transcriptional LysR family regulator
MDQIVVVLHADDFGGGRTPPWEFERDGEVVLIDPPASLVARPGSSIGLLISAAIDGLGVVAYFEDGLRSVFETGALVPVLEPWWQSFPGPFLYFPSRRLAPAPLRAFVDFIKGDRFQGV